MEKLVCYALIIGAVSSTIGVLKDIITGINFLVVKVSKRKNHRT